MATSSRPVTKQERIAAWITLLCLLLWPVVIIDLIIEFLMWLAR